MQTRLTHLFLLATLLAIFAPIVNGRLAAQTFATLYSFSGGNDGAEPFAGLTLSNNTLYGTTPLGGNSGEGNVFALNTDGTGFKTLYSFSGLTDGFYSQAALTLADGVLYGTAHLGGPANNGTVFAVNTEGTGFINLHSFTVIAGSLPAQTNNDGATPQAGLLLSAGTLYGTAVAGGSSGYGTVFALNTDGTGFKTLHSFTVPSSVALTNRDGANPYGGLVLAGSTLFGTARSGGLSGHGTVFALNTDGTGFKALHSFSGTNDGGAPFAGLVISTNTLYGATLQGGSWGQGTLFALQLDGTGFSVLHSFNGASDGANPAADLTLSGNTLYGTATYGGSFNNGTVFAIHTDGTAFTNLYSFTATSGTLATNRDGANPFARLTISGNTLFGTAKAGGNFGQGTLFSISLGSVSAPLLTVTRSGADVILTWPANASSFSLQSTTNFAPTTLWTNVSPGPILINGQNTVTNPVSGARRFYRLSQ